MLDSHACIKTEYIQEFHHHINSINSHTQFTIQTEKDNQLPFLDTKTSRKQGRLHIAAYRKATHTDTYLDYNSHPTTHKQSNVNTLLGKADKIPTSTAGKRKEWKHVMKVLKENDYPFGFFAVCKRYIRKNHQSFTTREGKSRIEKHCTICLRMREHRRTNLVERMQIADFKCLFWMVIEAIKTAFFSFWSIFIDPNTIEVRLFRSLLIEFTIKSSKYAINILFWFSSIQLCMRSCISNLDRDTSKPDFFTYLSLFFYLFIYC